MVVDARPLRPQNGSSWGYRFARIDPAAGFKVSRPVKTGFDMLIADFSAN